MEVETPSPTTVAIMEVEKPSSTTVEGLRLALEELGLSTKGHKPDLKLRLRKAKKKQKESSSTVAIAKEESPEDLDNEEVETAENKR
jgi:hypothetical protein